MSVDEAKNCCEQFLRSQVPNFTMLTPQLPSRPAYRATPHRRPGSWKYEEVSEPNWWQLPREACLNAIATPEGRAFVISLEETSPFKDVLLQTICIPQLQKSMEFSDAHDLAKFFLVQYLFASGGGRWQPATFQRIWEESLEYLCSSVRNIKYVLYAPVVGMSGAPRSLDLGDELHLRLLTPQHVAQLGTLSRSLAGYTFEHRFPLWTRRFLVRPYTLDKVAGGKLMSWSNGFLSDCEDSINEEVVLLRSLLSPYIAVPSFALILQGSLRDPIPDAQDQLLVWTPRWEATFTETHEPAGIRRYRRRRSCFLGHQDQKGWANVFASMRRYAVAWENPFPADTLADLVSALEVLTTGDARTEVSYKMRVRATRLLAKTDSERREIMKD
jgi:hypothetical protein